MILIQTPIPMMAANREYISMGISQIIVFVFVSKLSRTIRAILTQLGLF